MIEIILPSWFPFAMELSIIIIIGIVIFWFDYTRGLGLASMGYCIFLVELVVVWLSVSSFGLIPEGSMFPQGIQLFNISVGAP